MQTIVRSCFLILVGTQLLSKAIAADSPRVALARVPDSGLQPQAVIDAEGTLHLVYLKGDPKACDVMYVRRPAGQSKFTLPLRVNSQPGSAIAIGTVRGAELTFGRNGCIHVAWNGSDRATPNPSGGCPMLYSRLLKGRSAFEPQRNLMTMTTHLDGGGAVAADSEGHVYVVWHGHKKTGPQEEIDRRVFVASSADDGQHFTVEREVNPPETGVCGCCGLAAFAGDHGALAVLYRSADALGDRDSTLLVSTNYGTSFAKRVLGQWHVSTCPMSTHGLGPGQSGFEAMWEKQGKVYSEEVQPARLDAIPTSVAETRGQTDNRKHPRFSWNTKHSACLKVWTEGTGWEKGGSLAWECVDAKGNQFAAGRSDGVPVWSFAAPVPETDGSFTIFY